MSTADVLSPTCPQASFDGLRVCIPELEHNDKSPKVTILQGATDFIAKLKQRQTDLLASKDSLGSENARLMIQLRHLQTQLSAAVVA
jgi:predicted Mrr-cat superfamily restriction endonuclease